MDEETVDSPQAVDEAAEAPEAAEAAEAAPDVPEPAPPSRGRPKGKADGSVRTRRTAAEVAQDKISLAQAKVDALRLQLQAKEAAKAAARKKPEKKTRVVRPPSPSESSSESPPPRKKKKRAPPPSSSSEEEPQPRYVHRPSPNSRRKALYQSWFTR